MIPLYRQAMRTRLPLLLAAVLLTYGAAHFLAALWLVPAGGTDFQAFYTSAAKWKAGMPAYAVDTGAVLPNLTPPFLLPVFSLFTYASPSVAFAFWTLFSILCVALALPGLEAATGFNKRDLTLLALGTAPAGIGLVLGQLGGVLLLVLTRAWLAARNLQPIRAGLWCALLCSIKPFYGLLILWFVWRRSWQTVMTAAGGMVIAFALSAGVAGMSNVLAWVSSLTAIDSYANVYNASTVGLGARLFWSCVPHCADAAACWLPLP